MKKIDQAELEIFLRKHKLWLAGEPSGSRADLRGADLYGANLRGADLRGANLRGADLRGANLRGANLYEADLRGADLRGANLYGTNLYEADLYGANLYEADLRGANLYEADLRGANLYGADLYGAENISYPIACPEKGSFTAFKKANGYIIELEIPEDALRCSAFSRKCRCSKAKVISITNRNGTPSDIASVPSGYDNDFVYVVGEIVTVDNFDKNRWNECAPGIHFFVTRQEAVDYMA